MDKIATRKATESDTETARKIHHEAYRDVVTEQFGAWDETVQDKFFEGDWKTGGFEMISCDNEICGYIAVDKSATVLNVREIVISPNFQGKGIGTYLLKEVIKKGKAEKIPVKIATFHKNNAVNLYKRLGFQEVEKTDIHILFELE